MKIGIDSYCFHRYFGEVYPSQTKPQTQLTLEDFLRRAVELQVDGVSLESCFIPRFDSDYLAEIKAFLDENKLERVYAWGHPMGLEGGRNPKAFDEMIESFSLARAIGARVMRVVGSNRQLMGDRHPMGDCHLMGDLHPMGDRHPMVGTRAQQLEKLTELFTEAAKVAEEFDIRIAVENHNDYSDDEFLRLLQDVDSPYMGLNFDTGNFVRLLIDPLKAMKKLKSYVFATHLKDLKPEKGLPVDLWHFFACTAIGAGLIDNLEIAKELKGVGYEGLLTVEIDYLHAEYENNEDRAVAESVRELRRISQELG